MTGLLRDRVLERTLAVLLAITAATVPLSWIQRGTSGAMLVVPYLVAVAGALVVARAGHPRIAARLAAGGVSALLWVRVVDNGAALQDMAFLPLLAAVGWTLLGR